MKILCISDTHNKHTQITNPLINNEDGSIDVIIHAGDMTSRGYKNEIEVFLDWYDALNFKHKILIAGNHDFYMEQKGAEKDIEDLFKDRPSITYLNDSGTEIDGVKFWGSPVQPWFYNWAFNRLGDQINKHWDMIPLDTEVLITHGGPKNLANLNLTINYEDVGCPFLEKRILELKNLSLFVQGHIHEGYGVYQIIGGPTFINASLLNENYKMQNKPFLITLNEDKKVILVQ